jgi:tetratricopeptide (TPR) repeat protein
MLLGADFFLSHRIYISRQQHRMFFTYNGGPVFRLGPASTQTAAGGSAPAGSAVSGQYSDIPTDAAGFTHRGEASMSRRDYAAAVADFSKAAELEPNEPQHFRDRARAHLANRQPVLAMSDFDQALKLKPDDATSLIGRGELYLVSKDMPHARADFDAAVRADPQRALVVAALYGETGHYDEALAGYDAWIAAHPKAENLSSVFNGRCWTRAIANRDLDKAIADCDLALRRGPRNAAFFDSRGLAHLRHGDLDLAIADYNEALKLQPRLAWSLYGRGLARLGKGDKGGEADIAAATAIAPNLPAQAKRYGVSQPGVGQPGASKSGAS